MIKSGLGTFGVLNVLVTRDVACALFIISTF